MRWGDLFFFAGVVGVFWCYGLVVWNSLGGWAGVRGEVVGGLVGVRLGRCSLVLFWFFYLFSVLLWCGWCAWLGGGE